MYADRASGGETVFSAFVGFCGRWLWASIFGTVRPRLKDASAIHVVPTGLLGLLPLHLAMRLSEKGEVSWLADELDIRSVPCAAALVEGAAASVSPTLAAVRNPRTKASRDLPWAEVEVDFATSLFQASEIPPRDVARTGTVLEMLGRHRVWHFACHGKIDFRRPLLSALSLSGDDVLTVSDFLSASQTRPDLVVLSACELGQISRKHSAANVSLPAAVLIAAGSRGVVSAMWPVVDEVSAIFMIRFYDFFMRSQLQPAEAIYQTQKWLRGRDGAAIGRYLETEVLPSI
jgi:CHAT domain-containing protein